MMHRTWLFAISLLGMSVSASVVILLVPSLFRPGEQGSVEAVGVLGCLAVAFAVGALRWRPSATDDG